MSGPGYHGRTHAAGGTDPIPGLASSSGTSLPVAFANGGLVTSGTSVVPIDFDSLAWNDDTVFGYAVTSGTSPKKARFITVTPGTYIVKGQIGWLSALGPTNSIQLMCYFPSIASTNTLANVIGTDAFSIESSGIWNEQKTTDEKAHLSLHDEIAFSWTTAGWGETTLGLGVRLSAGSAISATLSSYLMVARLGDATTDQTIT